MHATEESHEPAKHVVIPVEDGELTRSDNSFLTKRKKDKYTPAAKASSSNKSELNRGNSKASMRNLHSRNDDNFQKDEKKEQYLSEDDKSVKQKTREDDITGSKEEIEMSERLMSKDGSKDGKSEFELTERHISGKSENYETMNSQANQSVIAVTENEATEIPEDNIAEIENTQPLDKTCNCENELLMNEQNEGDSGDEIEEIAEEIVDHCSNLHRITNQFGMGENGDDTDADIDEDIYSKLIETASIYDKSELPEADKSNNISKESSQSGTIKTEIDENTKNADSMSLESDVIEEDLKLDSIKIGSFDEAINDDIKEKEHQGKRGSILPKGD